MNVYRVLHSKILTHAYLIEHYRIPLRLNINHYAAKEDWAYCVFQDTSDITVHIAFGKKAYLNLISGGEAYIQRQGVCFL